jgi:hypothetical protein
MKEPRTLKQIIQKANKEDELSFAGYTEDYLKEVAVDWIKYLSQPESPEENIWIADWIKMFFNLKDAE